MKNAAVFILLIVLTVGVVRADTGITVTDFLGRELVLDRPARRVACLYAFASHTLIMLGSPGEMVAVVRGVKKDRLVRQVLPGVKKLPVVSAGGIIHIEALLKTDPDLVFLKPETAAVEAEVQKLERFNLPWFSAGYNSMAGQMDTIRMMGRAVGREGRAQAYIDYYRRMIERVRSRTRDIPENRRVRLYHSINEPLRTDAPNTIEADWTLACGVVNVSLGRKLLGRENKHFASMEQVLIWNPDLIIVNEEGVDAQILGDRKWVAVKAVKKKKVFQVPVGVSRWGHPGGLETPLALAWTAKTVYPERFADFDLARETQAFYKTFFDLDLDDRMTNRILKGRGMRDRKRRK